MNQHLLGDSDSLSLGSGLGTGAVRVGVMGVVVGWWWWEGADNH